MINGTHIETGMKNEISYMQIAYVWAQNSKAQRQKVGCIIVKDGSIISDGYNGTPSGFDNVCEDPHGITKKEVLHAESNAIAKLAKSTISSSGSSIFLTLSPCYQCAQLIIQSDIIAVYYSELYRDTSGIALLEEANIYTTKLTIKDNPYGY